MDLALRIAEIAYANDPENIFKFEYFRRIAQRMGMALDPVIVAETYQKLLQLHLPEDRVIRWNRTSYINSLGPNGENADYIFYEIYVPSHISWQPTDQDWQRTRWLRLKLGTHQYHLEYPQSPVGYRYANDDLAESLHLWQDFNQLMQELGWHQEWDIRKLNFFMGKLGFDEPSTYSYLDIY